VKRRTGERGQALIETTVTVAIFSLLAVALAGASIVATRGAASDPPRDALARTAQREALLAADVLKYQGSQLAPQAVATTVPLANGSPLPAIVSLMVSPARDGRVRVRVQASANGERAESTLDVPPPAPLPGSQLNAPQSAAQPTGAP
jgi:hypothetical protein